MSLPPILLIGDTRRDPFLEEVRRESREVMALRYAQTRVKYPAMASPIGSELTAHESAVYAGFKSVADWMRAGGRDGREP